MLLLPRHSDCGWQSQAVRSHTFPLTTCRFPCLFLAVQTPLFHREHHCLSRGGEVASPGSLPFRECKPPLLQDRGCLLNPTAAHTTPPVRKEGERN